MRRAVEIKLTDEERETLQEWSQGTAASMRLVARAKVILLAADGLSSKDISWEIGMSQPTVGKWRKRFGEQRLAGIEQDLPRAGRPPSVRLQLESEIVRRTTREFPPREPHWSAGSMAKLVGTSHAMVERVWRDNRLHPQLTEPFSKHFAENSVGVICLCLPPPNRILVLCCDRKFRRQAQGHLPQTASLVQPNHISVPPPHTQVPPPHTGSATTHRVVAQRPGSQLQLSARSDPCDGEPVPVKGPGT